MLAVLDNQPIIRCHADTCDINAYYSSPISIDADYVCRDCDRDWIGKGQISWLAAIESVRVQITR